MELWLRRSLTGFEPATDDDREAIRKHWKFGEPAKINLVKPRNYRFHQKAFALLKLGHDNLPETYGVMTFEEYREAALIAIGWVVRTRLLDGTEHVKADSMSFARLDDTEFEKRVYSPLIDLTMRLIGVGREDLEREVLAFA